MKNKSKNVEYSPGELRLPMIWTLVFIFVDLFASSAACNSSGVCRTIVRYYYYTKYHLERCAIDNEDEKKARIEVSPAHFIMYPIVSLHKRFLHRDSLCIVQLV